MKILHYSDQGDDQIKNLFQKADALFSTGDLSIFDFSSIEKDISLKPCFGIYGNHCTPGYLEKLGIQNMHLKTTSLEGLIIGGYQGCLRYKVGGGPQFTEEEALADLKDFPFVDILLLHAAPFGLLDTPDDVVHTGSHGVREYVERASPKYIFCGHDSPSTDMNHNGTKLFRTHKSKIIEIVDEGDGKTAFYQKNV